jgi:hypothetical protein
MAEITLPYKWTPRPYQLGLWGYLATGGKRAVTRWHRRSGKDDVFLHHTACSAHERVGSYWYMLPEYSQARKSMWDAVSAHTGKRRIDEAFPKELRKTTREQEMFIEFHNGSTFQLVGSDNFNSLVGSPPVGLVFSEYALSNPASWAYLMPILEENGGWAGFNSTPRGNNHFKKLCEYASRRKDWFYQALTAKETGVFSQTQLKDILEQLQDTHGVDFGAALYEQEYNVSFDAAIPGSIWGDCVAKANEEGRICDIPVNPDYLVYTAWDLGRTDDTAIWFFQIYNGNINIVDFHASSLKEIEFYANYLREWKAKYGCEYGTHFVPHDARPRRLGMGGKSILQQFQDHNVGRFVITANLDVQEGIQAARATFPRVRFDEVRCADGLEALKQYHRSWDEEKQQFSTAPVHDWSSHAADAFRYLSLSWKDPKTKQIVPSQIDRIMKGNISSITFGELKKQHLRRMAAKREFV